MVSGRVQCISGSHGDPGQDACSLLPASGAEGAHSASFFWNSMRGIRGLSLSPTPTSDAPSSRTCVPKLALSPRESYLP